MPPALIEDLKEIERTLALLKSRDLRAMGFEAKTAHERRLERLNQAHADALRNTQPPKLPDQEPPTDR